MSGPVELPESVKTAQRVLTSLDWLAYRLREEGRAAAAESVLAATEALVEYVDDHERQARRAADDKGLDGPEEQA